MKPETAPLAEAVETLADVRPRRFRPYPAYRPSGVDWFDEIPKHWSVRKLKYLATLTTHKNEGEGLKIGLENVESHTGRYLDTEATFEGDGVSFQAGDILYGKLRPYLAKVLLADTDGSAVGDFFVLKPGPDILPRYLQYRLLERAFTDVSDGSTFGAKMPRVDWKFLGNLKFSLPPLPEQRAIAAFLDRETAKIDGLVEKKRRLIDLLKEKRTALISRAVTKGLDPAAPMKPSGIDWLGDVPGHWDVRRLKFISELKSSNVDKKSKEDESQVRLCNYTDVYHLDYINDGIDFMQATASPEEMRRFGLKRGDVLITKDSEEWNDIAVPAYVEEELDGVVCGYHLAQVRADPRQADGEYLFRAFTARPINDQFRVAANGITRFGLSKESIASVIFPVPPLEEQKAISAFLRRETAKIDGLVLKAESVIESLSEYRSALISAAVTGKIDVRGEA